MPSDSFTLGWASDNPRAAMRAYELCEGHPLGAALLRMISPTSWTHLRSLDRCWCRWQTTAYGVAPDGSDREDPARLLGEYQAQPGDRPTMVGERMSR
jgi:hypothetical protein